MISAASASNGNEDWNLECALLECLNGAVPPVPAAHLTLTLTNKLGRSLEAKDIDNLLQKFAYKELIR